MYFLAPYATAMSNTFSASVVGDNTSSPLLSAELNHSSKALMAAGEGFISAWHDATLIKTPGAGCGASAGDRNPAAGGSSVYSFGISRAQCPNLVLRAGPPDHIWHGGRSATSLAGLSASRRLAIRNT